MSTNNEYWYRTASLVYDAVLPALIGVIHNDNGDPSYTGLPRNDIQLYNILNTQHKKKLKHLNTTKMLNQKQYDILLPPAGKTDSSVFDVSLAYLVIRNLLGLKTKTKWDIKKLLKKTPKESSIAALKYTGCNLKDLKVAPLDGPAMDKLETRVEIIETDMDNIRKDIDGLQQNIQVDMPRVQEDVTNLQQGLNEMSNKVADSLSMILGIVHSKSKHLLEVDESMKSMHHKLKKINEGIHHLKMRDVNLSQHQLERTVIRFGNKFAPSEDALATTAETNQEIDSHLKSAQESALAGLSSGLGYVEQIQCIKIVLITDCFYVLNALFSLYDIKSDEIQLFAERLKNAQDMCENTLRKLNNIVEIREYLSNKLLAGSVQESLSQKCRRKLGIDMNKSVCARDVITINICIRFFLQLYEEKLELAEKKNRKRSEELKKIFKIGSIDNERNESVLSDSTEFLMESESSATIDLEENIIYIGAAFSVIENDAGLAQLVDHYIMSQKNPSGNWELVKQYLRQTKGVQKAVKNKRVKAVEIGEKREKEGSPAASLKIFEGLAAKSTMDRHMSQKGCMCC